MRDFLDSAWGWVVAIAEVTAPWIAGIFLCWLVGVAEDYLWRWLHG